MYAEFYHQALDTLLSTNIMVDFIKGEAEKHGIPPEQYRLRDGSFALMPLLLAKSNILSTIATYEAINSRSIE